MVTRTMAAAAFLWALVLTQTPALLAQEKLGYLAFGGIGARDAEVLPDKWPWLYSSVVAYEVKTGRPVAWFGACKEKDKKSRYLYLVVFKTLEDFKRNEEPKGNPSFDSETRSTDKFHQSKISAWFAKHKVELEYKIDLDEQTGIVGKQFLKVCGTEVKEGEPRVFVVDLTKEKVVYHPIRAELPDVIPDGTNKDRENWDAPVRRAVEQLKKKSPEVKKFLEP